MSLRALLLAPLLAGPVRAESVQLYGPAQLAPPFLPVAAEGGWADLRDAPRAVEPRGPRVPPSPQGGGWSATKASLLLYDASGRVLSEIGLGEWRREAEGDLVERRRMRGGVSADGRFAWHWQRVDTLRVGRTEETLTSARELAYLGTAGQILWTAEAADAPPGLEPLYQSADGETALVVERRDDGWALVPHAFTGNRAEGLRGAGRLLDAGLTRNGRFAWALWGPMDGPLAYTFLDLRTGQRKDLPPPTPPLRLAIGEDGTVRAGGKKVFSFTAP